MREYIHAIDRDEYIPKFAKDLFENQEPLVSDFQKVLNENYWELLE